MSDLSHDPLTNLIVEVSEPIRLLLKANFFTAALKLIYSGIDTMAYLGLADGEVEVKAHDFENWCRRYCRYSLAAGCSESRTESLLTRPNSG
ncbi:MAG: hypothetical protein M0000_10050 [Actinomycetota bacterium]|nr:hypothetical protein [Actinomycetota bacterium]